MVQRRNHRLDRAEIYIDVTIGYISLSDFKIESLTNQGTIQNIATGYYTSWIKIEDNYIVRKEVVNPTFVQRSEYYGKIV